MLKINLIFILLLAACTTEPVETHDDNAILQLFLNIADPSALESLKNEFDIDENEMTVQESSDFITEHLSRYINSVRVEYDEWDGYEFHHERGDV